jgi:hypothetical protein
VKINRYIPFAFIYFFLNSLGLPWGMTYTLLLSPLIYYWVVITRKKEILLPFMLPMTVYFFLHLAGGVVVKNYFLSFLNMTGVYIFSQAVYTFLIKSSDPGKIFRQILIVNFILCLIAIPFYFTQYADIFWIKQVFTAGVTNFLRLKLLTYEASYYATLFTPIFLFYFFQIILRQNRINVWLLSAMLVVPYILSLSLGVMSAVAIACTFTYLFYFKVLTLKRRVLKGIILVSIALIASLTFLAIFFPENAVFVRIGNILSGNDISGSGRTTNAFYLASKILDKKNPWWGIGEGQLKLIGAEVIKNFYGYDANIDITMIAIPNATAETLVTFGWVGLCIRLLLEIGLFFRTKVWKNYYRLSLFLFIFFYQFTGSFLTNNGEYVIWILAFTNVFAQFDVKQKLYLSRLN